MTMNTYAGIKANVRKWTVTDTTVVADTDVDDMLYQVEAEIWAALRVPEMRSYYTWTYAAGGQDVSGFDTGLIVQPLSVTVEVNSGDFRSPIPASEEVVRNRMQTSDTSNPTVVGWVSEADGTAKLVIAPEPIGKTIRFTYFRKFAPLSNATNLPFLAYPHVWMNGLMRDAFLLQQDTDMFQVWDLRFQQAIAAANQQGRGLNESLMGNTTAATWDNWKP
jgi:hypothetical protein